MRKFHSALWIISQQITRENLNCFFDSQVPPLYWTERQEASCHQMLSSFALTSELFATECVPNMTAEHCYVNSWPFCVKHLFIEVFLCVHHTLTAFMLSFLPFSVQDKQNILIVLWVCRGGNIININYVMFTDVFIYQNFRMHSMPHSCSYCCYFIQGHFVYLLIKQLLASFTDRVSLVLSVMHNMSNPTNLFILRNCL